MLLVMRNTSEIQMSNESNVELRISTLGNASRLPLLTLERT